MAEQPIDETRATAEGAIHIVVEADGDRWRAAITGPALEAVQHFDSVEEANDWARASFRAMFPE